MAIIFDGKEFAAQREKILAKKVADFKNKTGITPKLAAFMVGDNPASSLYLKKKSEAGRRVGIEVEKIKLAESIRLGELTKLIKEKNSDPNIHGVMMQLPLPLKIKSWELEILCSIEPRKDVDCLTPQNLGLLAMGKLKLLPATVKAILAIIQNSKLKIQGANVVIVGASNIVGKPLTFCLSKLGATVTICRSKTKNLGKFTRRADLLISATGVPKLIKADMIKEGAVVIDVGSPVGDVDFINVAKIASFITPVPGGVGPLTVVCLLENLYQILSQNSCKY